MSYIFTEMQSMKMFIRIDIKKIIRIMAKMRFSLFQFSYVAQQVFETCSDTDIDKRGKRGGGDGTPHRLLFGPVPCMLLPIEVEEVAADHGGCRPTKRYKYRIQRTNKKK